MMMWAWFRNGAQYRIVEHDPPKPGLFGPYSYTVETRNPRILAILWSFESYAKTLDEAAKTIASRKAVCAEQNRKSRRRVVEAPVSPAVSTASPEPATPLDPNDDGWEYRIVAVDPPHTYTVGGTPYPVKAEGRPRGSDGSWFSVGYAETLDEADQKIQESRAYTVQQREARKKLVRAYP